MNEPCRLCGSEPEVATYYDFYRFHCPTPGCPYHLGDWKVYSGKGKWYGSIDEARDAWNQRQKRGETPSATETAEQKQAPAEDGDGPEIGEIIWHREVIDGYHPSDCPYCGCERVVIGEYEPCHDDEWDYHIEHKNPKEAIGRKCFEMYAAFKTPEDAVRGADMRATEWAVPVNEDTMRVLSDVCRRQSKRQLRAEAVERLRETSLDTGGAVKKLAKAIGSPWEPPRVSWCLGALKAKLIDLLTDDDAEITTMYELTDDAPPVKLARLLNCLERDYGIKASWDGLRCVWLTERVEPLPVDNAQADSQERLEADVIKMCHMHTLQARPFLDLLDRQDAITERRVLGREWNYIDTCESLQSQVDELEAECDRLREKMRWTDNMNNKLREELRIEREAVEACEGCEKVDSLTAELKAYEKVDEAKAMWARAYDDEKAKTDSLTAERDKMDAELKYYKRVAKIQADSFRKLEAKSTLDVLEVASLLQKCCDEWMQTGNRIKEQRIINYYAGQICGVSSDGKVTDGAKVAESEKSGSDGLKTGDESE